MMDKNSIQKIKAKWMNTDSEIATKTVEQIGEDKRNLKGDINMASQGNLELKSSSLVGIYDAVLIIKRNTRCIICSI